MLMGTMNAPLRNMMYAMNGVASKLVRTLAAVADKKEKEPAAAPAAARRTIGDSGASLHSTASWPRRKNLTTKGEDKWQHSQRNRFWTRSHR